MQTAVVGLGYAPSQLHRIEPKWEELARSSAWTAQDMGQSVQHSTEVQSEMTLQYGT